MNGSSESRTRLFLVVDNDGTLHGVHHDDMAALFSEGEARIVRASHVEPAGLGWTADMSPVDGPVLGPFTTRAEALEEERAWLEHYLTTGERRS